MELLTPEEQILETFQTALTEELNPQIEEINLERNEQWLPQVGPSTETAMTIGKVNRSIDDDLFTKEDYTLTLTFTFRDNKSNTLGYRYSYALTQMIKQSPTIPKIADFCLIREMLYIQNPKGDPGRNRKPSSSSR